MADVEYFLAGDNPMFPPIMTAMIRFARYEKPVRCAHCGKKRKLHWTMLVPFWPQEMGGFAVSDGEFMEALTPVCREHPMSPQFMRLAQKISTGTDIELQYDAGG